MKMQKQKARTKGIKKTENRKEGPKEQEVINQLRTYLGKEGAVTNGWAVEGEMLCNQYILKLSSSECFNQLA